MSAEAGPPPHNPQDRVTAFWDMVAPHYESDPANLPAYDSTEYAAWVDFVRSLLPPGASDILDLATGTGFIALIAARLGHRVTALDLSNAMLEVARTHARERQLPVAFLSGDAVDPRFPDGSFDVITNRFLLWTLREPGRSLKNWHTLLRPGGRLITVNVLCAAATTGDETPEREDVFARYYTSEVRQAIPFLEASSHKPLVAAVEDAGFTGVTVQQLPAALSTGADQHPFLLTATRQ